MINVSQNEGDRDAVSDGGKREKNATGQLTMSDTGKDNRKGGMFEIYDSYDDHLRDQKERAKCGILRLQEKIKFELSLTESLLDVGGREVMQGRLVKMESLEEEISSIGFHASQLFRKVEDGENFLKEMLEEEDKIRKMKEQVVKLMVKEAKERDKMSEVSGMSKRSRTSKVSSEGRGKKATMGINQLSQ